MTDFKIRTLLIAIASGCIVTSKDSMRVLGIHAATFTRWVAEAESRGVRFRKNQRGGARRGENPDQNQPWRVERWGDFRAVKKEVDA